MKLILPRALTHSFAQVTIVAMLCVGAAPAPFSTMAHACAFDLTKPERTSIDWILEAETLVLARPNPQNPYSYRVVEVLRGDKDTDQVPLLVHTLNRKMLLLNPDDTVLFRQDEDQKWIQVAYNDRAFNDLLQITLANVDMWKDGYHPSRFAVFEALQSSPTPRLRELALRELDKAPYEMLRDLEMQFSTQDLLDELWTLNGYPYQPIRVLLLGLSDDDKARKEIYAYFSRVEKWDNANNIGAFAAALIELEGTAGVAHLDKVLMSNQDQPLNKLLGVIGALAVQRGVAAPGLRQKIDHVLARMVSSRPETAPLVAQQFSAFSDWSQQEPLEILVRERRLKTAADLMVVSVYVARARGAAPTEQDTPEGG